MAITSLGIGSGLDINGLVQQLVQAEGQPPTDRLNKREGELQARLSGIGTLKSSLSSFQSSLSALNSVATFNARTASSSDSDIAAVTASASAPAGIHELSITQLAKSHKLATDPTLAAAQFTSDTAVVGTGTLTFKFGTTVYDGGTDTYTSFTQNAERPTQTVEITDGSLKGIRDAINNADIGVNASIVYDGSYYRLAISSTTGAANSLEISATDGDGNDTDASGLSLLAFNASATNLAQNQEGIDAQVAIDGIQVTSAKNTLTAAIDGVSLELKATGDAAVTVSTDTGSIESAIKTFVSAYNDLIGNIKDLSKYDPETKQAGVLQGDAVLRSIASQVTSLLGYPVNGGASVFSILADIGITKSSQDGKLQIDETKLSNAVSDNSGDIAALFAAFGKPSDSLVSFVSANDATKPGSYEVNITQLATQGTLTGSAAANLTVSAGVNDTLNVVVDGVAASITLSAGTYTAAALASEVQSRINGTQALLDAGVSVEAGESAGVITLTSTRYGSASSVDITGGNGKADLVGASPTAAQGLDVAGTIGGVAASGSGQTLIANGAANGLKITISGGSTGDRGTVSFSRGYADQLNSLISKFLGSDGSLQGITDAINSRISDIGGEREALARRLSTLEQRLLSQFIALDTFVSKMRSTGDYLTQQLASLPSVQK